MKFRRIMTFMLTVVCWVGFCRALEPVVACDMERAKEICSNLPLENVEGIWLYPDDKITVMILGDKESKSSSFPTYTISVVETADARLNPGEIIGKIEATSDDKTFRIELKTEKKNDLLLKPKSCLATLSADGDVFTIKKRKTPLKLRLNLNFNRLLPGFWKIVSTGISSVSGSNNVSAPAGMVKIYPSYDGNGSSRRKVRYL